MFLGGSIGSRAFGKGGGKSRGGAGEADYAAIRRQAEMMSLEQVGEYQSMQERGWIDADGKWTSAAPDVVRRGNVPDPGSPEVLKAAREGVEHVNEHPELIREGADGKRHAKVDEEHEIVEVEAPAGLACEYHSPGGPRIECPEGMGSSRHDVPGQEEGPAAKKGPTTAPPVEPGPTGPARPDLPADNLITVRKRHHGALREKEQITANRASAVYEKGEAQRLIEETNHKLEAYRSRHPKAGPENDTIRKFSDRLSNLEKTVATHDETITRILDVCERVFRETSYRNRWAIDHAETIKAPNIARIRAMSGGIGSRTASPIWARRSPLVTAPRPRPRRSHCVKSSTPVSPLVRGPTRRGQPVTTRGRRSIGW